MTTRTTPVAPVIIPVAPVIIPVDQVTIPAAPVTTPVAPVDPVGPVTIPVDPVTILVDPVDPMDHQGAHRAVRVVHLTVAHPAESEETVAAADTPAVAASAVAADTSAVAADTSAAVAASAGAAGTPAVAVAVSAGPAEADTAESANSQPRSRSPPRQPLCRLTDGFTLRWVAGLRAAFTPEPTTPDSVRPGAGDREGLAVSSTRDSR
ncbi:MULTISPECIES: hypothetical protein [unclassified Mycobacterium]|uniref:hypothetical protein n=1 Tax=unclassified Mycobacterium TaxID=2642494 RepID=UPI0018D3BF8A|nr:MULTISPECIES: hypothetical protein [unclassified Mycobacterium]